ncbi:hypothetical protein ACM5EM_004960, partial [Klebsiella pneumoniae]
MSNRYNTGNPRPSNSMKDLNDNALAYDDFMLSEEGTFVDRLGNEVPTLKGLSEIMRQAGESVVENTRKNLIPLSRQYMTLEAAQADIANIPKGSTTYYRSPDDSALAIEIINNGGTLEHTGREMPSQYALREPIKEAAHASQSPASAGVSANDIDDEYEYAIADRQGRIIERINADFIHRFIFPIISQQAKLGSAKGLSGIFYQDDIALGLDASGNVTAGSTETGTSNDMLYGVVDSSGRCLFRYDARGKFRAVLHEDVIRQISQEFGVSEFKKRMLADRVHIQMCGQSLAGGIGSGRISSAATATGWLMPSGGIEDGQTLSVGLTGLPLTSS